ncbi:SPOR domain-containing protein [Mesonia aquimarina]|uniref:SPOR domain-containing protein n=1 Tax=Mesonia aquimarina TaxID=1504967 RepID=UPI000EF5CA42|nr:SPOR domain-containing protein [Mesonia aquimarina]
MTSNFSLNNLLLVFCIVFSLNAVAQDNTKNIEQDPLIPELLVLQSKMTESNELGDRYKIQLFYGSTLSEANKVKKEFENNYKNWPVSIEFETPNYKVWVGDFRNKLEAERAYIKLKEDFKSAFIFKPKG